VIIYLNRSLLFFQYHLAEFKHRAYFWFYFGYLDHWRYPPGWFFCYHRYLDHHDVWLWYANLVMSLIYDVLWILPISFATVLIFASIFTIYFISKPSIPQFLFLFFPQHVFRFVSHLFTLLFLFFNFACGHLYFFL